MVTEEYYMKEIYSLYQPVQNRDAIMKETLAISRRNFTILRLFFGLTTHLL